MNSVALKISAVLIAFVAWIVPAIALTLLTSFIPIPLSWLYGFCIWTSAFIAWNSEIVSEAEWICIERFGQFEKIKFAGLQFYLLRGIIDQKRASGTLQSRELHLFEDNAAPATDGKGKGPEQLDFTDGSAPVEVYITYQLYAGNAPIPADFEKAAESITKWIYANKDPVELARKSAENILRPALQAGAMANVSSSKSKIIKKCLPEIRTVFETVGLHLAHQSPLVIADVGLSDEQRTIRDAILKSEVDAKVKANVSSGDLHAIDALMKPLPDKSQLTRQEAIKIWSEQQSRKAFADSGARITIIAKDTGVVNTFGVNKGED